MTATLTGEQQGVLFICWIAFALALSYGKYAHNDPLKGTSAFMALACYIGGGLGALIVSGVFTILLLKIMLPVLYLYGTYAIVKEVVPYQYKNE